MLQGNPFETELWVQERVQAAAKLAGQNVQPQPVYNRIKEQRAWLPRCRQVQVYWLPAVFALGALLGFLVGG